MWETWVYKTIIAFISMNALKIVFKVLIVKCFKKYGKRNKKSVGFIKSQINTLLTAMIPFVRWIMLILIIICIIAGSINLEEKSDKDDRDKNII